ncbi:MAG: hypothetical protein K6F32_02655 [Bacilli bacterium]|nr:hypothetical protein [Bacilli bacterium]
MHCIIALRSAEERKALKSFVEEQGIRVITLDAPILMLEGNSIGAVGTYIASHAPKEEIFHDVGSLKKALRLI